jgi:hypothetical protein
MSPSALPAFVVTSDLVVDPVGVDSLEQAFRSAWGRSTDIRVPTPGGLARRPGRGRLHDGDLVGRRVVVPLVHEVTCAPLLPRTIPVEPAKAHGVGLRRFTIVAT